MTLSSHSRGAATYGALELKQSYQTHLLWGLLLAATLHLILLAASHLTMSAPAATVVNCPPPPWHGVIVYPTAPPEPIPEPPSFVEPGPPVAVFVRGVIPTPVPDDSVATETLIATRLQASLLYYINATGSGEPGAPGGSIDGIGAIPDIPPPTAFTPMEVQPKPVLRTPPVYPAQALATGLEGDVVLRVYIDFKGHLLKAFVIDASPEGVGFEEAAVAAVRQWTFTPALQNNHPVSVWVNIPIQFRLR